MDQIAVGALVEQQLGQAGLPEVERLARLLDDRLRARQRLALVAIERGLDRDELLAQAPDRAELGPQRRVLLELDRALEVWNSPVGPGPWGWAPGSALGGGWLPMPSGMSSRLTLSCGFWYTPAWRASARACSTLACDARDAGS